MRIALHPDARGEARRGALRYELARPGLGVEFLEAIDEAVTQIAERPRAWPRWEGTDLEVRRLAVSRFPYMIPFVVREDLIVILAIAHTSRHPAYWLHRLRGARS